MTKQPHFENAIFRYRSIKALLGPHKELERQTVYFSPPEKLNDPMEGMRQIYWRGDGITWRNLLRHYVVCLQNRVFEALVTEDSQHLNPQSITVFQSLDNFPTPDARSLCEACIEAVEGGELHAVLLDLLSNAERNISFAELQQLLGTVHLHWLGAVSNIFRKRGLMQQTIPMRRSPRVLADILRRFRSVMPQLREQISDDGIELLYDNQRLMAEQMALLAAYEHADMLKPKRESLFFEFPTDYLNNLIRLVYPPWCVAVSQLKMITLRCGATTQTIIKGAALSLLHNIKVLLGRYD